MAHPDRREFAGSASGNLASYLPAVRYALRLAREREERLTERLEPIGLDRAKEARRELEELRAEIERTRG